MSQQLGRRWNSLCALAACGAVLLAGCVGSNARQQVARGIAPLTGISAEQWAAVATPLPAAEILAVDAPMRAFAEQAVGQARSEDARMQRLSRAVLHPGSLGLRYDERHTRVARDAFSTANGNCLTLSMLFVALAREVGIDARFYEVNVVPEWRLAGDIVFATRHINVGGELGGGSNYVMDFSPYRVRREVGRRQLSDAEAIAQYYNNIGAELLAENQLPAAYLQFREGLRLAPTISFLWSNLSVVYSRNGQTTDAEQALRQAIRLDAENTSALTNLARLLEGRGQFAESERLKRRIAGVQKRNPYYQFALGERLLAEQRFDAALSRLQEAIKLQPREPMFYLKAADAALKLGNQVLADQYMAKAESLDSDLLQRRRAAID